MGSNWYQNLKQKSQEKRQKEIDALRKRHDTSEFNKIMASRFDRKPLPPRHRNKYSK